MQTVFAGLIGALGNMTGLKDLQPDRDGACDLVFDDLPVTLQLFKSTGQVLFYCVVGDIPDSPEARLGLYSLLLDANFFFRRTGGATLSADGETGQIALQRFMPVQSLDAPDFLEAFEKYLKTAEYWRRACSAPRAAGNGEDAEQRDEKRIFDGWIMA